MIIKSDGKDIVRIVMRRLICKCRKLKIGVNDMNNVEMMRESNKIKFIQNNIIALFAVCLFNNK